MQVKAPLPLELIQESDAHPLIQLYFEFNHLKQLYRQGWLERDIPREVCESVADHTFGVAVLALVLGSKVSQELDMSRVLRMALLHDFGEVYAGDLTPGDGLDPEEKSRRERKAVERIFSKLPDGKAYIHLWEEFEAGESTEARFVRQIDRLEMALQAGVYRAQGYGQMDDFFASAERAVSWPELRRLLEAVKELGDNQER